MPENPPKSPILEIVDWIDSKQANKKTAILLSYDSVKGEMKRTFFWLVIFFFVVWVIVYEYSVNLAFRGQYTFDTFALASSTLLAAMAAVLAGMALMQPYMEGNETQVRYERALRLRKEEVERGTEPKLYDFTDEEKPFVKTLIGILGKNKGFTLRQLYDIDKTKAVFSEEKLLEKLLH